MHSDFSRREPPVSDELLNEVKAVLSNFCVSGGAILVISIEKFVEK